MANQKRQRQDALRAQKLAQAQVVEAKERGKATRSRVLWIVGILVALLALFLFLSRGNTDKAADTTVPAAPKEIPAATTVPATTAPAKLPAAIGTKPVVSVPSGPAPKSLQKTDLVVGKGPEVTAGSNVLVNYVGVSYSTKEEFDTSWGRAPFSVDDVGNASVIKGWNEGLVGMKEGGRRQLVIPADLAYGASSPSPKIKANETLIFVIDAIKVTPKA